MSGPFDQPEVPPTPDECIPCQNKEIWQVPCLTDCEDYEREWVRIAMCPFGGPDSPCTSKSWNAACVWSLHGYDMVVQYLMRHATHSSHHGPMQNAQAYEAILAVWEEIKWEKMLDTFKDRQARLPASDRKRKGSPRNSDQDSGQEYKRVYVKPEPTDSADDGASGVGTCASTGEPVYEPTVMGQLKEVAVLFSEVMARQPIAPTMAHSMLPPPATFPPVGQLRPVPRPLHDVLPGIVLPREKILVMQDNLQHADQAMDNGMVLMMQSAQTLQSEQQILRNTIAIVASTTGVEPMLLLPP